MSFKPWADGEPACSKSHIELCIQDINKWMTANKLMLNSDKTELLVLNTRHQLPPPLNNISIGPDLISTSNPAKNIGVWFHNVLSMDKQISNICKSAFYHLRNIAKIRKFISFKHSKLDYCNSLLSGLNRNQIQKLQYVQNSAACLLTGDRIYEHITPILKEIHWLPGAERIDFKILLITFKVLNDTAPSYLKELLTRYNPSRTLRSAHEGLLIQPKLS